MKKTTDKPSISQSYQRNLIQATVSTNIGINNHDRLVKAYGSTASRIEVLNKLKQQSKFTIWWFSIFIVLGIVCLFLDPVGWFNVIDLFILMVNIYLVSKGKLIGIYIGILECFFYAFICFNSQLYGEVIKSLCISVPLNTFSIISWTKSARKTKKEKFKQSKDDDEIIIRKMKKKELFIFSLVFIACTGLGYVILRFLIGQKNALLLSSIALAISITGKILTAKRYMESYRLFTLGNLICLFMWAQTMIQTGFALSDLTMIVYYICCFTYDIYAFELWKGMYRKVAVNGVFLFAQRKVNIKKIIKLRRQFKNLHWDREIDTMKNS